MIIKLAKIISCSSEHPSYPASNLLQRNSKTSWRVAKPGEMLGTVIFELAESCCITGLDIGNYRSCVVIVSASTSSEPDVWTPVANHQFMTNDEAANGKFKDQVEIFTKKELNPDTVKMKFDRVKVTCMQSANLKELFGLTFITFKTEVVVDLGLDVFGRFKLKQPEEDNGRSPATDFKHKYLKMVVEKKTDYRGELISKIKETGMNNFVKRQEENREPAKRPLLEKLEAGKSEEVFGSKNKDDEKVGNERPVKRTPFGDVVPTTSSKENEMDEKDARKNGARNRNPRNGCSSPADNSSSKGNANKRKLDCSRCQDKSEYEVCENCGKLPESKQTKRPGNVVKKNGVRPEKAEKLFSKLFEGVSFSLSGYVHPQRDEIRRKALDMGARYVADPNTSNKKCTHLICAFKNTPKYQQLKGHSKIVTHSFIEDAYREKTRFPWRRYALDGKDKAEPESEEEITGSSSPPRETNVYEQDTDSDSYY
ncbi:DNA repair protein XRCC1 [Ceratina calcarata]|uniref:DNA repair protein XRCC1 n=1 Tax=Ceratina calcarata TaxID=156304 RepID=A0AAJ7J6Y8_9HYME|nr:DNA repair protein XRCC1 [Ceratina calcarata]